MEIFKLLVAVLVTASGAFIGEAIAQPQAPPPAGQRPPPTGPQTPTRGEEKRVEGQVKSVHPSGTEIMLTDGTRLVTPPGAVLRPGVLAEGATVIASYREENGNKVLTDLELKEPSASPPTGPRTPGGPPAAPPSDSPKRY
jgi:hypothetical protein